MKGIELSIHQDYLIIFCKKSTHYEKYNFSVVLHILHVRHYGNHFVEDTPEVRNWLDNMFQHLDKSKIPHGLLRDYAFELADLDIYNGKELNDSNYVDRVAFENLLRTVRSSSVGAKPFNAEEVLATQHSLSRRGKGIIGVVLYQYSYIREDALSSHLIRYENEQVFDNEVNGVWQNRYLLCFIATLPVRCLSTMLMTMGT